MVNTIPMHVLNGPKYLVYHTLDLLLRQRRPLALDCFVKIHVHKFKNQGKSTRWLVVENL